MRYSSLQAPKVWTRHLSVLLFAFSLLLGPLVQAQSPPVEAWFTPGEFESGDELTLHIDYGSVEEPVPASTEISLTFEYEGFDITSEPYMDVIDSWFCEDGNCDTSIEVDNEERELKVTISRTNGQAVGGYGRLGKGKGIIIEMIDVISKNAEASLALKKVETQNFEINTFSATYDYNAGELRLLGIDPAKATRVLVLDVNGKQIVNQVVNMDKLGLSLNRNNIYLIYVESEGYVDTCKLLIK